MVRRLLHQVRQLATNSRPCLCSAVSSPFADGRRVARPWPRVVSWETLSCGDDLRRGQQCIDESSHIVGRHLVIAREIAAAERIEQGKDSSIMGCSVKYDVDEPLDVETV